MHSQPPVTTLPAVAFHAMDNLTHRGSLPVAFLICCVPNEIDQYPGSVILGGEESHLIVPGQLVEGRERNPHQWLQRGYTDELSSGRFRQGAGGQAFHLS